MVPLGLCLFFVSSSLPGQHKCVVFSYMNLLHTAQVQYEVMSVHVQGWGWGGVDTCDVVYVYLLTCLSIWLDLGCNKEVLWILLFNYTTSKTGPLNPWTKKNPPQK